MYSQSKSQKKAENLTSFSNIFVKAKKIYTLQLKKKKKVLCVFVVVLQVAALQQTVYNFYIKILKFYLFTLVSNEFLHRSQASRFTNCVQNIQICLQFQSFVAYLLIYVYYLYMNQEIQI